MPSSSKRKSETNQICVLLHDGPLHHYLENSDEALPIATTTNATINSECSDSICYISQLLDGCIRLIRKDKRSIRVDENDDDTTTTSFQSIISSLVQSINDDATTTTTTNNTSNSFLSCTIKTLEGLFQTSESIHDQLTYLRAYRSKLLQIQTSLENKDPKNQSTIQCQQTNQNVVVMIAEATYRILLEWSVSCKTTFAVRRASHSCLQVLSTYIIHDPMDTAMDGNDKSSLNDIHASILQSLSNEYHDTQEEQIGFTTTPQEETNQLLLWNDPVHTLIQLLAYEPTLTYILDHPPSIVQIVALLISIGDGTAKILQPYFVYPKPKRSNHDNNDNCSEETLVTMDNGHTETMGIVRVEVINTVETVVKLCCALKELVAHLVLKCQEKQQQSQDKEEELYIANKDDVKSLCRLLYVFLETVLIPVLRCKAASSDATAVCSVTLGHILFYVWKLSENTTTFKNSDDFVARLVKKFLSCLLQGLPSTGQKNQYGQDENDELMSVLVTLSNAPSLAILSIVKAVAATFPNSILLKGGDATINISKDDINCSTLGDEESNSNTDGLAKSLENQRAILIHPISSYISDLSQTSTDNAIRLSALKGLQTVMVRCHSILLESNVSSTFQKEDEQRRIDCFTRDVQNLSNDILQISLTTWESPPCRQVESAIPSLFQNLIDVKEALYETSNVDEGEKNSSLDILVKRVLAQPPNRKGRYVALDVLLTKVGASKLLKLGDSCHKANDGTSLEGEIIYGASQLSSSPLIYSMVQGIGDCGSNSGAIAELLGKIISLLRIELYDQTHTNTKSGNHKWRKKKERELKQKVKIGGAGRKEEATVNEDKEINYLLPEWTNLWAKPISSALLSSECSRRNQVASFCLPLLTTFVGGPSQRLQASYAFAALLEDISSNHGDMNEAVLWAKLEIVRHAAIQKLLKRTLLPGSPLRKTIATRLSVQTLRETLQHGTPSILLVAFQVIADILPAYDDVFQSPTTYLQKELDLYRLYLSGTAKTCEKENATKMIKCVTGLLRRLLDHDLGVYGKRAPLLKNFVVDFMLKELFVKQCYPGAPQMKETWSLSTIKAIVSFASQSTMNSASKSRKKTQEINNDWRNEIMGSLLKEDVFFTLMTLLNSIWDNTREKAFDLICDIILYAKDNNLNLPEMITTQGSQNLMKARAIHLASSPRQRESSTGARILAIICISLSSHTAQYRFLEYFANNVCDRLNMMEQSLGVVLGTVEESSNSPEDASHELRKEMPLAHGLIESLRLIVQNVSFKSIDDAPILFDRLTKLCCRAIEISLTVVADMKDADSLEDSPEPESNFDVSSRPNNRWMTARAARNKGTPLNVNTGALGANSTFAALNVTEESENMERYMIQRIMVGTWLVMKEACASLASVLKRFPTKASFDAISVAGDLLISTLTSLKHQGAAFAAHKALQQICTICYETNISISDERTAKLPSTWSQRLLHEISGIEVVRDSTLRRSTGYGLGFLSILRSEIFCPKFLFLNVITNIIKLSLPSTSTMEEEKRRYTSSTSIADLFCYAQNCTENIFVQDEDYEWRGRVHALNILRLIILDAPLAKEMRPYVGDAILSALIGYKDNSWAVRNSATMTFAAAMLRVVDADKNADRSSEKQVTRVTKAKGSAITIRELHRSYPELVTCLISMLQEETSSSCRNQRPTLFPILLLLSRLQPASFSMIEHGTDYISDSFVDPVMICLGHVEYKMRVMAARTLAVLCTGDSVEDGHRGQCGRDRLLEACLRVLSVNTGIANHNLDHGALLGIKALVTTSLHPEKLFDGSLPEIIAHYGTWGNGNCFATPPSVAIALEIWYHLFQSSRNVGIEFTSIYSNNQLSLHAVVAFILSLVEYFEQRSDKVPIGLAGLGATAANIICNLYYDLLFDTVEKEESQLAYVEKLIGVMNSSSYDVRVYSIKALKKRLMNSTAHLQQKNIGILERICTAFVNILDSNLKLDIDEIHPSTMRRLSRCAIEVLSALKALHHQSATSADNSDIFFPKLESSTVLHFWDRLQKLYSIGCSVEALPKSCEQQDTICGHRIPLAGNALELMSFLLPSLREFFINECSDNGKNCLEKFIQTVCVSTDSHSNWAVRYSAIISIANSGFLLLDDRRDGSLGSISGAAYLKLYSQVLKLLQDDDNDVRNAAGRIALREATVSSRVGIVTMKEAYEQMCSQCHDHDALFHLLVSHIIEQTQGIEDEIAAVVEEYNVSISAPPPSALLNLSSKRKIFEEECTNSFEESLLIVQFAIHSLVQLININQTNDISCVRHDMQVIALRCKRVLLQILTYPTRDMDITHDITWNRMFPKIHGVVLTSSISQYLGFLDDGLVVDARHVFDKIDSEAISIHPCIKEAIRLLSLSKKGDKGSFQNIVNGCFLIPTR